LVLIRGIEWQDEGRGRVPRLQKGGNEEKQNKGGTHKVMLRLIDREGSEDASPAQLRDSSELVD
jgi:hypothetical protein